MVPFLDSLKNGWARAGDNSASLLAAGIAYYAFLSLVPLLAVIILTYGLVADAQTVAQHTAQIAAALPAAAGQLINDQITAIADDRGGATGWGLVLAIALSLFGARVAAGSVIEAMNLAFAAEESRNFIKANLLALAITIGAVLAIGLVVGVTALVSLVLAGAGSLASFLVIGLAGLGAAMIAYRVVPNTDHVSTQAALRGGAIFAVGWMAASAGFSFYAANFGNYNATYGSLGAIVVLLTWLYLSAYLLLLGAHFAFASMEANTPARG